MAVHFASPIWSIAVPALSINKKYIQRGDIYK